MNKGTQSHKTDKITYSKLQSKTIYDISKNEPYSALYHES